VGLCCIIVFRDIVKLMNSNKNWIQNAIKRPGAFTAKAKRAGISVKELAEDKKDAGDTTGKQARLALTLAKLRGKK
jgi:hypothetical protein